MREQLIKALLAHAQGDIAKHKANIEVIPVLMVLLVEQNLPFQITF